MEYSKISVSVAGSVSFSDARTGNLFQRFLPGSSCRLSGSYHCDFVPSSQLVSYQLLFFFFFFINLNCGLYLFCLS